MNRFPMLEPSFATEYVVDLQASVSVQNPRLMFWEYGLHQLKESNDCIRYVHESLLMNKHLCDFPDLLSIFCVGLL